MEDEDKVPPKKPKPIAGTSSNDEPKQRPAEYMDFRSVVAREMFRSTLNERIAPNPDGKLDVPVCTWVPPGRIIKRIVFCDRLKEYMTSMKEHRPIILNYERLIFEDTEEYNTFLTQKAINLVKHGIDIASIAPGCKLYFPTDVKLTEEQKNVNFAYIFPPSESGSDSMDSNSDAEMNVVLPYGDGEDEEEEDTEDESESNSEADAESNSDADAEGNSDSDGEGKSDSDGEGNSDSDGNSDEGAEDNSDADGEDNAEEGDDNAEEEGDDDKEEESDAEAEKDEDTSAEKPEAAGVMKAMTKIEIIEIPANTSKEIVAVAPRPMAEIKPPHFFKFDNMGSIICAVQRIEKTTYEFKVMLIPGSFIDDPVTLVKLMKLFNPLLVYGEKIDPELKNKMMVAMSASEFFGPQLVDFCITAWLIFRKFPYLTIKKSNFVFRVEKDDFLKFAGLSVVAEERCNTTATNDTQDTTINRKQETEVPKRPLDTEETNKKEQVITVNIPQDIKNTGVTLQCVQAVLHHIKVESYMESYIDTSRYYPESVYRGSDALPVINYRSITEPWRIYPETETHQDLHADRLVNGGDQTCYEQPSNVPWSYDATKPERAAHAPWRMDWASDRPTKIHISEDEPWYLDLDSDELWRLEKEEIIRENNMKFTVDRGTQTVESFSSFYADVTYSMLAEYEEFEVIPSDDNGG